MPVTGNRLGIQRVNRLGTNRLEIIEIEDSNLFVERNVVISAVLFSSFNHPCHDSTGSTYSTFHLFYVPFIPRSTDSNPRTTDN